MTCSCPRPSSSRARITAAFARSAHGSRCSSVTNYPAWMNSRSSSTTTARRQSDTTANLVFKPAKTITELFTFPNVAPGNVLLTGGPKRLCTKSAAVTAAPAVAS
ncbi:hypothetical protein [Bradyrhizobium sp. NBAIM08]|uniref:hypothetical protein n=1 Tax=Bradyrhizobium sp. NBAIM08 TaxID=2793815 RepID=UPI0034D2B30D